MIRTTLITGPESGVRETAIIRQLDPDRLTALILEGIPNGDDRLDELAVAHRFVLVNRIAPGCICCAGNLVMRVTLDRVIRKRPQDLFISLANAEHLGQIRHFLQQEPYNKLLSLTDDTL